MFFPERIRSIRETDRVLEIGPGSMPHPRADVFLDRRFPTQQIAYTQRGNAPDAADPSRTVYYDGGRFPFDNQAFDYVICSHVIEHVPDDEMDLFVREIQRVASRGYLEFPSVFYELINYQKCHHWMMSERGGVVLMCDKKNFQSNFIHRVYRDLFYAPDRYLYQAFRRYKEVFFCGFEWHTSIRYQRVDDPTQLINASDYRRLKNCLAAHTASPSRAVRAPFLPIKTWARRGLGLIKRHARAHANPPNTDRRTLRRAA